MSYEELREQCAQIAEKMPDFSRDAFGPVQHRIATTIRALPLPEDKDRAEISNQLNYPDEWDTAAYPTLETALIEFIAWAKIKDDAEALPLPEVKKERVNYKSLSGKVVEQGWRDTFSVNNPYCPCDLRTFEKSVVWAERELGKQFTAILTENEQLRQRIAELESNKALNDVAEERRRQVDEEGFSPERDDMYDCHQLSKAAVCYAIYTLAYPPGDPIDTWPWDKSWWKPSEDERRNRVKAAALLIAEIERLDRVALKGGAA